ncbi:hypothetical protein [Streptomyces drozdowiczii]|uniref:Uncharacterized protein n=1 Tax=Streptomyces drozdowiczii TaxID=202862 RepID=A0ABY6Q136_9ACTN|nr:hypothetical protein [Streptomyces drozdowiczii]MCX0241821.1 hypothetical protein [Streptomyces drozdowiczii]UZK58335.1 hypothetical protein NEH16_33440 [Streptomyces drozdowiczii]
MQTSRRTRTADQTPTIHRTTQQPSMIRRSVRWIARRRTALLSSALRGAAYATGAGIIGLGFYVLRQQI